MLRARTALGLVLAMSTLMLTACSSGRPLSTGSPPTSSQVGTTGSSIVVPASSIPRTTSTAPAAGDAEAVLYPVRYNGKWGYIDRSGTVVVEPQFDEAYAFSEGLGRFGVDQETVGKFGFIDATGAIVIAPRFSWASDFCEGLSMARAVAGGKCGYIDRTGAWAIEPRFANAGEMHDGLASVQRELDDLCGYIDKTGTFVIEPVSREALAFSENLAVVAAPQQPGARILYGYIDKTGAWAIQPRFYEASRFSEGLALVSYPSQDGEEVGYIDSSGNVVFTVQLPQVEPASAADFSFSEGLAAWVGGDGHWGFIDKTGSFAIAPEFDQVTAFTEGVAAVCVDLQKDTWGYIDAGGGWAIEPQFHHARPFSHGLALVVIGDKQAYIDHSGAVVWKTP